MDHVQKTEAVNEEGEGNFEEVTPVSKVFGNDMLMERILKNIVIRPNGELIPWEDIRSLRTVGKSWLHAVSDVFRKRREPLLKLSLTKPSSWNHLSCWEDNAQMLVEFTRSVAGDLSVDTKIPPFNLKLEETLFDLGDIHGIFACFSDCGQGIISLDMQFPINNTIRFATLPLLQRLTVSFPHEGWWHFVQDGELRLKFLLEDEVLQPLQTILNGTTELKEFHVREPDSEHFCSFIPSEFGTVILPQSITSIILDIPIHNIDLKNLLMNQLPNLSHLGVVNSAWLYDPKNFYSVLEKHRTHLRTLQLGGKVACCETNPFGYPVNQLMLPEMESLETLKITSRLWELDESEYHRWGSQLPVLKKLVLTQCTAEQMMRWGRDTNARSNSLNRLVINPITPQQVEMPIGDINYYPYFDYPAELHWMDLMRLYKKTMRNLTSLEIPVLEEHMSAVQNLFWEMRGLRKLCLIATGRSDKVRSGHWDSLLIGVNFNTAVLLRLNPHVWPFIGPRNRLPCIMHLNRLQSLELRENFYMTPSGPPEERSLITHVAFNYGFLTMQSLRYLTLSGRFEVTPAIARRWEVEKETSINIIR